MSSSSRIRIKCLLISRFRWMKRIRRRVRSCRSILRRRRRTLIRRLIRCRSSSHKRSLMRIGIRRKRNNASWRIVISAVRFVCWKARSKCRVLRCWKRRMWRSRNYDRKLMWFCRRVKRVKIAFVNLSRRTSLLRKQLKIIRIRLHLRKRNRRFIRRI